MQEFLIAPAGMKPLWLLLPVGVVLLVVAGILTITIAGARGSRFEVAREGLRLRGDLYGRFIPASSLRSAAARRVDLQIDRDLLPRWRTFGTAFPGYRAGWFRLHNGEKALLYLTDVRRAVYVPTTEGFSLLISPADPDRFLSALRDVSLQNPPP